MKENNRNTPDDNSFSRGDPYRIAYLVAGYIGHTLTEQEHDELDEWVAASEDNTNLFGELTDEKNMSELVSRMRQIDTTGEYEKLKERIGFTRKYSLRKRLLGFAAAASVLLVITLLVMYYFPERSSGKIIPDNLIAGKDLPPGGKTAILTLQDGKTVDLSKADTTFIGGDQRISRKITGELVYAAAKETSTETAYHTLTTPEGGQYKVMLPDGTSVWLNAASSLKYPVSFSGDERLVELKGEGYFEVSTVPTINGKGKKKFVVKTGKTIVQVLGTHFNINAYTNEPAVKTTLLEGKVEVTLLKDSSVKTILLPGEQAIIEGDDIKVLHNIMTTDITAWKDGLFRFKDADIKTIMRQVSRWYNAEVIYNDEIAGHFNATVERNTPVSKLLHYLQLTKQVYFSVKDHRIIVSAKPDLK